MQSLTGGLASKRIPFASLKKLFRLGAADEYLPLLSVEDLFVVNSSAFIQQEYPQDPTKPTRTVYETKEETVKHKRTGIIVLYVILILIFLGLMVFFIYRMKNAPKEGGLTEDMLMHAAGSPINPSEDTGTCDDNNW